MSVKESTDSNARLDDLLEEFAAKRQADPEVTPEAFIRDHPDQAEALNEILPVMQMLADLELSRSSNGESIGRPGDADISLGRLGDFQLVRQIGRGGMGIVYEAQQLSLGRRVALKVLPFAGALDAKQLRRFQNEALAAGRLHHTNIVPVYYVGCERGVHFYAMQLIDGQTIADLIRNLRKHSGRETRTDNDSLQPSPSAPLGPESANSAPDQPIEPHLSVTVPYVGQPDPYGASFDSIATPPIAALSTERSVKTQPYFRAVANLGAQAADALEHAHELGVVHRDVKPANLLLDARSNLWVTDFGLAQFQDQAGPTLSGDLIGTLRYMSPEQALAKRVTLDHRTDIYSLGATLYEVVTLEPVFSGRDRQELLRKIAFQEPRPPRHLNSAISADLETIILKAMAKDPQHRYATAKDMADDLRRYLANQPIRARRPTFVQRAAKWCRRHRVVVSATILALMAGLVACCVVFWQGQIDTERERRLADEQRRQAEDQRQLADAQRKRAEDRLELARQAFEEMYSQTMKWLRFEPWASPDQQQFMTKALDFYRQLTREQGTTPAERYRTAVAFHRISQLNYRLWYTHSDSRARAKRDIADIDQAITLLRKLAEECPVEPKYLQDLAACYITRAEMLNWIGGQTQQAESAVVLAKQALECLPVAERTTPRSRRQQGICNYELAVTIAGEPKRREEAHSALSRAQDCFRELANEESVKRDKARPDYLNLLAAASAKRGELLKWERRYAEGERVLRESLTRLEDLDADSKLLPDFRENLGKAHNDLADLLRLTGRSHDAEVEFHKAVDVYQKLVQIYPHVARFHGFLGTSQLELARCLHSRRDLSAARAVAEDAVHHQHVALDANPGEMSFRFSLQDLNRELAAVLVDLGDLQHATVAADEVADIVPGCPVGGAKAMIMYADIVRLAERDTRLTSEERNAVVKKYMAREKQTRPSVYNGCHYLPYLANEVAWYLATYPDARFRDAARASAIAQEAVSRMPESGAAWNTLGVALYRRGDRHGAVAALQKATTLNEGREPIDFLFLAMANWQFGKSGEARMWLAKADEAIKRNGPPSDEVRRFRAEAGLLLQMSAFVARR
jgi:serine/threonine protein kinase/Flp pilus assembly protein TadD